MATENIFNLKGLITHPSEFSVEPGALSAAQNVMVNRQGTLDSRRGYFVANTIQAAQSDSLWFNHMFEFPGNKQSVVFITTENIEGTLYYAQVNEFDAISFSTIANFPLSPDNANDDGNADIRTDFFIAFGSLFMTTIDGIRKFQFTTSSDIPPEPSFDSQAAAGIPTALGGRGATTGASGWFDFDGQVAYRVIWGIRDNNDNLILGPSSGRIEVSQAAGSATTRDVSLTIQIPPGITTDHFIQVYRSPQSADVNTPGNEEMDLVYEANPTGAEITAAELTFTDSTPDSLKGARAYFAPSQDGILNNNYEPPWCKCVALYKEMAAYANTRQKHALNITLLGVGGTTGVQDGDIITIAGTNYTAQQESGTADDNEFTVIESGTAAENIDATAKNLVEAINSSPTNTDVVAFYQTSFNDLPGKIRIVARNYMRQTGNPFRFATAFTVSVNDHAGAWLLNGGTSTFDEGKNRVYFSKINQYESVPLLRFLAVGSDKYEIKRILSIQDGLIVLKEEGTWIIYGEIFENLVVQKLDDSAIVVAPATAQVIDNRVYYLSRQGVVSAGMNGVFIESDSIKDIIDEYVLTNNFQPSDRYDYSKKSWAFADEIDGKYYLFVPKDSPDTDETLDSVVATQTDKAYVFDIHTRGWTSFKLNFNAANDNDGEPDSINFVQTGFNSQALRRNFLTSHTQDGAGDYIVQFLKERKDKSDTDHADREYSVTISVIDNLNIEFSDASDAAVGQYLVQGSNSARITAIGSGQEVTIDADPGFSTGAATLYDPVQVSIDFLPFFAKAPGIVKSWTEAKYFFRDSCIARFISTYKTEVETSGNSVTHTPSFTSTVINNDRVLIPREDSRGELLYVSLTHAEARRKFSLNGLTLGYENVSERSVK